MGEAFATTASVSCHSVTLTWPAASSSVLEYGVWHGLFSTAPDQLQRYRDPEAQNVGENLLEVGESRISARTISLFYHETPSNKSAPAIRNGNN